MAATEVHMDPRSSHRHGPSQTYSHLPASPTLTNPDMILPDYDRPVSPGMQLDDTRTHSPLMMWKNAHAAGPDDLNQIFGNGIGQQHSNHPYGPTGPMTPTTPIIYGNGTMLSDIGEVTEVESTPGRPSPGRMRTLARPQQSPTRGSSDSDAAVRSSPTIGIEHALKRRSAKNLAAHRERRDSGESTSTITTQERTEMFADFDDSVSVGDSVFQGDDEESVAESYAEQTPQVENIARLGVPQSDNVDRLSITSSTSLSRRAEEILANAKRKLTTMEDNLTRARSSLHIYSPSRSSLGSDSTPSPPFKRASTATYVRSADPSSPTSPQQSRFFSDTAAALAPAPRIGTVRSASALGASGGYRRPLTTSRSEDHIRNSLDGHTVQRTSSLLREHHNLAPLAEDAADSSAKLSEDESNSAKLNRFLSPTFGSFSDNGSAKGRALQRPASAAQMRDIKDQMKDLKGRLSSLREQARSDSMKRRSLQSLRTPSPFTHAQVDQWYAEPGTSPLSSKIGSGNGSVGKSPWNEDMAAVIDQEPVVASDSKEQSVEEEEDSVYSEIENNTQLRPPGSHSPEEKINTTSLDIEVDAEEEDDGISDMHTENGDLEDEEQEATQPLDEEAYYSESGESLYQDALQHPVSHEDREDAFDYEHFFLHSAMGTISQQRLGRRASLDSFTSEDSVVTTRPINDGAKDDPEGASSVGSEENETPPPNVRVRRNSDASVSTVGTFATANERGSPLEQEGQASAHGVLLASKSRPSSPESVRKKTFASGTAASTDHGSRPSTAITRHSIASFHSIPEEGGKENEDPYASFRPRVSVSRRPMSSSATGSMHRPSVSSLESTGTTRSFPLVNRTKKANSIGVLTPQNSSPDHELRALSASLLNETASICEQQHQQPDPGDPHGVKVNGANGSACSPTNASPTKTPQAMQTLLREDQYLVERLVATLGRCVLGLTESGKASTESRMYRRRIDAARRILEGLDPI